MTWAHKIKHKLSWQPIVVVSEWRGNDLWIGAECVECSVVSGWHCSRVKR